MTHGQQPPRRARRSASLDRCRGWLRRRRRRRRERRDTEHLRWRLGRRGARRHLWSGRSERKRRSERARRRRRVGRRVGRERRWGERRSREWRDWGSGRWSGRRRDGAERQRRTRGSGRHRRWLGGPERRSWSRRRGHVRRFVHGAVPRGRVLHRSTAHLRRRLLCGRIGVLLLDVRGAGEYLPGRLGVYVGKVL
jgi:hypothetical protein